MKIDDDKIKENNILSWKSMYTVIEAGDYVWRKLPSGYTIECKIMSIKPEMYASYKDALLLTCKRISKTPTGKQIRKTCYLWYIPSLGEIYGSREILVG